MTERSAPAVVLDELARLLDGEAAPGLHSPELAQFLTAAGALNWPRDHARIGAGVVELIVARCKATVAAERELALVRDRLPPQ